MNAKTTLAAAVALALLAGGAAAQSPPSPPPQPQEAAPPPPPPRDGRPGDQTGFRGGFGGPVRGPHMHMPMPLASKGASLRVEKGGGVFLKCADDDSTKACLEAAGPLLERLVQARP